VSRITFLRFGAGFFCPQFDEQTDAGDAAVGDVAAGLVAAAEGDKWQVAGGECSESGLGKDSVLPSERDFVRGDVYRAAKRRRGHRVDKNFPVATA